MQKNTNGVFRKKMEDEKKMNENKYFTLETESRKRFYQVPKQFMHIESKYFSMSSEAKLLYGILEDRTSLSIKNGWIDNSNRVYFKATVEKIMELMGCANQKATKLLKELRKNELLISVQKGQGKASWHYLLQIDYEELKEIEEIVEVEENNERCENHISRNVKITSLEMLKSHTNDTNINNTNINNTNISNHSNLINNNSVVKGKKYCTTEKKEVLDEKIDDLKEFTKGQFGKIELKKFLNVSNGDIELIKYTLDKVYNNLLKNPTGEPINNLSNYLIGAIKKEFKEIN